MSTSPADAGKAPEPPSSPDQAAPASPLPARNVVEFREGGAAGEARPLDGIGEAVASKMWQLATLALPILLTAWLTYWSSHNQIVVNQQLEKQNRLLTQQLALSEDLYKRRFDAYEKLYAKLVELNQRLQIPGGAAQAKWNKANADGVAQFSAMLELNRLHMSEPVDNLAKDAWNAGVHGDTDALSQTIGELETSMKKELDLWMLHKEEEQTVDTAAAKPEKSKTPPRSAQ